MPLEVSAGPPPFKACPGGRRDAYVRGMDMPDPANPPAPEAAPAPETPPPAKPVEIGGPKGPDPTRYGDWERAGRCVDF